MAGPAAVEEVVMVDMCSEIRVRLVHEPGCWLPGFRWVSFEPAERPGVLVVSAECLGCWAWIRDEELGAPVPG